MLKSTKRTTNQLLKATKLVVGSALKKEARASVSLDVGTHDELEGGSLRKEAGNKDTAVNGAPGKQGSLKIRGHSSQLRDSSLPRGEKDNGMVHYPNPIKPSSSQETTCSKCGEKKHPTRAIILDNNPLSIACYFEERCDVCGQIPDTNIADKLIEKSIELNNLGISVNFDMTYKKNNPFCKFDEVYHVIHKLNEELEDKKENWLRIGSRELDLLIAANRDDENIRSKSKREGELNSLLRLEQAVNRNKDCKKYPREDILNWITKERQHLGIEPQEMWDTEEKLPAKLEISKAIKHLNNARHRMQDEGEDRAIINGVKKILYSVIRATEDKE